jgi:hypothetical protein
MTGSLTDIDTLEQRLVDPSGRVTRPQTAQAKLHEARPWLELFLELGFTLGAEALATGLITMLENTGLDQHAADLALTAHAAGGLPAGWVVTAMTNAGRHDQAAEFAVDAHARGTLPAKDAVFALNAADRYQQAADLGRQAILDGVVDIALADRMGILYERHLDDLDSALWVSQTALGWPLEYPGTKIEAIRKRRDRIQKKLTSPPAPRDEAATIEHLNCQTCGETFTRTRSRGRKPHQCPACR